MSIRTHLTSLAMGATLALGSLLVSEAQAGDWDRPGYGYNWSGLYFGAGIGAAWGDSSYVFTNGNPANPNPIDFDSSLAGSVHLGIQHQWGNFVLGVETSGLIADLNGTSACPNPAFACSSDIDWVWMIGPRVGYAFNNWLVYGTGGYALASIESTTVSGALFDSSHERHGGWYLGGGLEWGITKSLSLGVEYKHIELDDEVHISSRLPGIDDRSVDASIDVVQARLTLRLGRDEPERVPLK
jgi:outer membrane immunogenic protein